jgi:hypothetical protein
MQLLVRAGGVEQRLACGAGRWEKGRFAWSPAPERAVAASGAWAAEDAYVARLWFHETPFCLTLKLQLAPDRVALDAEMNVAFGPTKQPRLEGRRE